MSSLPDRSESPRRRIRASGMHPGWACFMCALSAGFFTALTMVGAIIAVAHGWENARFGTLIVTSATAITLFIIGGRKAEKLWERP